MAFVHHLKIKDPNGYNKWLNESKNSFNSKRLFRVRVDPVAREGMLIDEIVIDEFYEGEVHRDAGLERVAIFMAKKA